MEESSSINIPLNLTEFRVLEQRVYPKRNLITVWIESRRLWAECPRCGSKSNKDVKDDHWRLQTHHGTVDMDWSQVRYTGNKLVS